MSDRTGRRPLSTTPRRPAGASPDHVLLGAGLFLALLVAEAASVAMFASFTMGYAPINPAATAELVVQGVVSGLAAVLPGMVAAWLVTTEVWWRSPHVHVAALSAGHRRVRAVLFVIGAAALVIVILSAVIQQLTDWNLLAEEPSVGVVVLSVALEALLILFVPIAAVTTLAGLTWRGAAPFGVLAARGRRLLTIGSALSLAAICWTIGIRVLIELRGAPGPDSALNWATPLIDVSQRVGPMLSPTLLVIGIWLAVVGSAAIRLEREPSTAATSQPASFDDSQVTSSSQVR